MTPIDPAKSTPLCYVWTSMHVVTEAHNVFEFGSDEATLSSWRSHMRPIAFTGALIGGILLCFTAQSFAAGEACTLITQTEVSAALEVPVDAGKPIASPSTCQWIGKGR